jgi:hypothetical protein
MISLGLEIWIELVVGTEGQIDTETPEFVLSTFEVRVTVY